MVQLGMANGMVKINQTRTARGYYHEYVEEHCKTAELTVLQVNAVDAYAKGVERYMIEVFKSAGKAKAMVST